MTAAEQALLDALAVHDVPNQLREGLVAYILTGRPTGGCLQAILCNDLVAAVTRADPLVSLGLANVVRFLANHAPAACFGYPTAYDYWRDRGGLNGRHGQR